LTEHTCNVLIMLSFDISRDLSSHVPQGSSLGPLLFFWFINDIVLVEELRVHSLVSVDYQLGGSMLERRTSSVDLGVLFTSSMSFAPRFQDVCARTTRSLGSVIRNTREFKNSGQIHSGVGLNYLEPRGLKIRSRARKGTEEISSVS